MSTNQSLNVMQDID